MQQAIEFTRNEVDIDVIFDDIVHRMGREMWSHVFHFLFCSAINHTHVSELRPTQIRFNFSQIWNKTLRDCSINTSRIELFHFFLALHYTILVKSRVEFVHFCASNNILMKKSWSHVGSQLRGFLPHLASKFNELLSRAHWFLIWISNFEISVSFDFISLGNNLIFLYFSEEAIIFQ